MVVVDLFIKYAHFVPLRHPFTAAGVARSFLNQVYRLHGLPSIIVSETASSPVSFGLSSFILLM
jgi:hypothetical protein